MGCVTVERTLPGWPASQLSATRMSNASHRKALEGVTPQVKKSMGRTIFEFLAVMSLLHASSASEDMPKGRGGRCRFDWHCGDCLTW